MWPRLEEYLRAIQAHDRIAVKAGRKVSKTCGDAVAALWWPIVHADGKVVITSSGNQNIAMVVWPQIRALATKHSAPDWHPRKGESFPKLDYPKIPKLPHIGIQWDDGRCIVAYSTDDPEKAAGVSGAHLLYILDEASGIEEHIFDAIRGNVAGGGKILLTSNPTRPGGFFYEAFNKNEGRFEVDADGTERRIGGVWKTLSIGSKESPNYIAGAIKIPGLATREWIEEMAEDWGEGSPLYSVHVEGRFPPQASDCVIPLHVVNAAIDRYNQQCHYFDAKGNQHDCAFPWSDLDGPLVLGIDPARFGDDETVIYAVRGKKVIDCATLYQQDGNAIADRAMQMVNMLRRGPGDNPVEIRVDATGGVGASPIDALARVQLGIRVVPVTVSERANDPERFVNRRAELWFELRDWLEKGGMIPDDNRLASELATPTYAFNDGAKGRMQVEAKEAFKRRLKRSPDRADALALAVCGHSEDVYTVAHIEHNAHEREANGYRFGSAGRGF